MCLDDYLTQPQIDELEFQQYYNEKNIVFNVIENNKEVKQNESKQNKN